MPQPGVSSALDSAPPDESGHRWPGKAKEEGLAHNSNTGNCKAASPAAAIPCYTLWHSDGAAAIPCSTPASLWPSDGAAAIPCSII
ncbi:hypothetical protein F7725_005332 [Dissostichus mawsoni]|uniref:Uncharacterized protein n=1 Tax=Dissostichus mawsoni TaxID=36200 RepID=A0A7J5YU28_DISMA|nr:hypothetical protein F7725_005332 [Dissostichus mawsoni]